MAPISSEIRCRACTPAHLSVDSPAGPHDVSDLTLLPQQGLPRRSPSGALPGHLALIPTPPAPPVRRSLSPSGLCSNVTSSGRAALINPFSLCPGHCSLIPPARSTFLQIPYLLTDYLLSLVGLLSYSPTGMDSPHLTIIFTFAIFPAFRIVPGPQGLNRYLLSGQMIELKSDFFFFSPLSCWSFPSW